MSELWPYQVLKEKISKFTKIWLGRKNCDNSVNFWDITEIFFSYGHWWSPLKVPLIILHKICLIGPSEAVKEVRVELTPPPMLWREKYPPCGIGLIPAKETSTSHKNLPRCMTKKYKRFTKMKSWSSNLVFRRPYDYFWKDNETQATADS